MKKIILLITILFVSVISTACINNLAVQELNNKAKEYMEKGETDKAISRLRSSIDLDTSIFETHYNLGVALIQAKDYEEAITSLRSLRCASSSMLFPSEIHSSSSVRTRGSCPSPRFFAVVRLHRSMEMRLVSFPRKVDRTDGR